MLTLFFKFNIYLFYNLCIITIVYTCKVILINYDIFYFLFFPEAEFFEEK